MNWRNYIVSNAKVQKGRPTVRGTRISVEFLISLLAAGWTIEEVAGDNLALDATKVRAALDFASEVVSRGYEYVDIPQINEVPDLSVSGPSVDSTAQDDSVPFLDEADEHIFMNIEEPEAGLSGLSEVEMADVSFTEDRTATVELDTSPESAAQTKVLD